MTAPAFIRPTIRPPGKPQRAKVVVAESVATYALPVARLRPAPADMSREDRLIERARKVLERRLQTARTVVDSPAVIRHFLTFELAEESREVFYAIFLNSQNGVIAFEPLFVGTLAQTSVHPRELVRRCLELGAAGVILAHNHPSGIGEPSQADRLLTETLKTALALVDVRVLDHFIVAGAAMPTSFAERGLL